MVIDILCYGIFGLAIAVFILGITFNGVGK
jgi:hypothetical protein